MNDTNETNESNELGDEWRELRTAALLGSGRRTVPAWPGLTAREGASPEERLLDAAAVGGAWVRAGHRPGHRAGALDVAAADARPAAPDAAVRLLELVLVQPPAGRRLQPALLRCWAREAQRRGVRVPHLSLVPLLTAATADRALREAVLPVLDERGRWLAGQRSEWEWAAGGAPVADDDGPVDADAWARRTTPERVAALAALRRRDPAQARELLATTWTTDAAPARADLLATLVAGLGDDDEDLLESALDDRSAKVREVARDLLDRLPASARAHRLGALLAPLVSAVGGRVHVELPVAPDRQAVRDGLGPGPKGRSERAWWLGVLTRGAPLETWTRTTGLAPATVVATLDEPAASLGLRAATSSRSDPLWARAHLAHGWEPAMVPLLPADEGRALVTARVARAVSLHELVGVLDLLDGPWSAELSGTVLARLVALPEGPVDEHRLTVLLATRLHPDATAEVTRLAARDTPLHDALHRAAHYLSFVPTLQESFA